MAGGQGLAGHEPEVSPDRCSTPPASGCAGRGRSDGRHPDNLPSILQDVCIERLPITKFSIADLVCDETIRLAGPDREHVRLLAEAELRPPPVLVHRPTMRVVDGAHRVSAAKLRGEREIDAHVFDGDAASAFVLAVHANAEHGLPLTRADRVAAATRILEFYPMWSDRAIARAAGLAAGTVGRIRKRSTARNGQSNVRLSRDGRVRPLNTAEGRRTASRLLREEPDAPLREIARRAGISPATAQDVRRRLAKGQDPVPIGQRGTGTVSLTLQDGGAPAEGRNTRKQPPRPTRALLNCLSKDPSLRFSDAGRGVLRLLNEIIYSVDELSGRLDRLPPHSTVLVAEFSRSLAQNCEIIANELDRRSMDAEG